MLHYASTKRYDAVFSTLIGKQLRHQQTNHGIKIDQVIVKPSGVTTALSHQMDNIATCLPEDTSRGSLRDLGLVDFTSGSNIHSLNNISIFYTPEPVWGLVRYYTASLDSVFETIKKHIPGSK